MKLDLGFIHINDIQFASECAVKDGILYVNAEDVKAFVYENDDVKAYIEELAATLNAEPAEEQSENV